MFLSAFVNEFSIFNPNDKMGILSNKWWSNCFQGINVPSFELNVILLYLSLQNWENAYKLNPTILEDFCQNL